MQLYHITSVAEWQPAQVTGEYRPAHFAADGFIHCSFKDQVIGTANRFYAGQSDLILLRIESEILKVPVKVENLEGGSVLFPHIYGPLPLIAVSGVAALSENVTQGFTFPAEF